MMISGEAIALSFLLLITSCYDSTWAQRLPPDEVSLLKTISRKMNSTVWNITEDSCGKPEWNQTLSSQTVSNVTCNCSFENGTICHVTNIQLKGFSFNGILPDEFGNLTYLRELDLTRNYLNGTIPTGFARLRNFGILSLLGNRLSGSIPPEIGEISTLEQLVLENNQLTGTIPQNLGNLSRLKRLLLSANNLTGSIPESFSKLKSLNDFRIDGNSLAGILPDFVGNWTNLTRLDMQGTSMKGPIPTSLSGLANLEELRITDLDGPISSFPDLVGLKKLEQLVLRNCRIKGAIPNVFSSMSELKLLDLSNNQLNGTIPAQLEGLDSLKFLYLNNNSLTGALPSWIVQSKNNIDCSYNNFTTTDQRACDLDNVNLVSSSSSPLSVEVPWCAKHGLPCNTKSKYTSLGINCGGPLIGEYSGDLSPGGSSDFKFSSDKFAFSSTGSYISKDQSSYVANNDFNLPVTGVFASARLAPQSLRFYGLCLRKGSYKVRLHFAEIMFSNNDSYSSLGKRLFNVAIQGEDVLRDFDIAKEAGGVGIGFNRSFDTIVNGSTLEIHLYWLGKGTNAIPDRGVYGPLINAIFIKSNFDVNEGLSRGHIAGIVVSSVILVAFLLLFTWYYIRKKQLPDDEELRGLDLLTGHFTLRQIKRATGNFDSANKIGEGGFGSVYKGKLSDGTVIAVKQLSSKSKQGNREFVNEIGMISALQHPNLVRLYGCCTEGNQLLLVYEYMENNCLARALFGKQSERLNLPWPIRKNILLDIAKGLAYLHEESRLKIVHRDIKATNVLLDKNLKAKISDFGLAKLDEDENSHISTRIAGTIGYMAPEYAMRGYLTDKADVYSFGVVALEIVSGKSNTNYRPKEEFVYLLDWAYVVQEQGRSVELVDPLLEGELPEEEAKKMVNLALLCTNPSPTLRPKMSAVVGMLEGAVAVDPPIVARHRQDDVGRFKALQLLSNDSRTDISRASLSMEGPFAGDSSGNVSTVS